MELFLCRISYQELLKRAAFHYPFVPASAWKGRVETPACFLLPQREKVTRRAGGEGENPDRTGTIIALSIDVSLCA
jgi:hypothetical protein